MKTHTATGAWWRANVGRRDQKAKNYAERMGSALLLGLALGWLLVVTAALTIAVWMIRKFW
jgi:hypothetical protein